MSQAFQEQQKISDVSVPNPMAGAKVSSDKILIWAVFASLLLIGSGVVRTVQTNRYSKDSSSLVECPFPLASIPQAIDGWHVLEGSDTVLDPLTTRITGSTDHIIRTYVDEMAGPNLSVLVLFGPAEPVIPHTPQVCYPSSGFQTVGDTIDPEIKIGDHKQVKFRSSIFAKSGGRSVIRQAVYHSFFFEGVWSPSISSRRFPRRNPGIFKVQIQRRVIDGEKRDADEPIEDFIKKFLPVIEKMISEANRAKDLPAST